VAGTLVVVATPIGNLGDLSPRAAETLRSVGLVLAEDTRHTGRLLAYVGSEVRQRSLHEHNERERIPEVLAALEAGQDVALVSDAGTPGVSDPGYRLLAACVAAGHELTVVPGPTAAVAALVVSGLPTDRVVVDGFLPRKGTARRERLQELSTQRRTIVVFVSPHRLGDDLDDLAAALGPDRRAALARELTKRYEQVLRGTLGELRARVADGVRGEITLVIAGAPIDASPAVLSDADLVQRVRALLATGLDKKAAIAEVAAAVGRPKREVYQALIDAGA